MSFNYSQILAAVMATACVMLMIKDVKMQGKDVNDDELAVTDGVLTNAGMDDPVAIVDKRVVPGNWEGRFYMHAVPAGRHCPQRVPYNKTKLEFYSEFGYELIVMVPYAYWLHLNCYEVNINTTAGGGDLYSFFADSVHESKIARHWSSKDKFDCCPLSGIHFNRLVRNQWTPPPYKTVYQNWFFIYDKPLLVISNKYNTEWGGKPINYIPVWALVEMVDRLSEHYTIVYSRPDGKHIAEDLSEILDLKEKALLKAKGVMMMEDLYEDSVKKIGKHSYNMFQMWVFANCERYIAVQGGNSAFLAYLAGPTGRMFVYMKRGMEVKTGAIENWYQDFSGAHISTFQNLTTMIESTNKAFIPAPLHVV